MIFLLFALQIFIVASVYIHFKESSPYFKVFFGILPASSIVWLFNCEMDSTAKLTWMIIFFLFPVPGTILFVMTQTDFGHYAIKKRVEILTKETKNIIPQDENVMADIQLTCSGTDDLCRYVSRTGCFPIYTNTETRFYSSGEEKFASVIEELEKAENFIFMEYFIIAEGYMWGKILETLKRKAAEGIEIRVMYDGMCEMSTLTHDYPKRLAELGIKCKAFAPITPFLSTYYNYRDHRKILVIDGKTAFTGGINFADEYINRCERFGYWKDSAVMLKGEAVRSFTLMFLQIWNISEKSPEWDKWLEPIKAEKCGGFVMPYADCPLDDEKVGENVYIDILNRATSYVHIMTPYLILDGEMKNAIKFAAQ
ncbi:MAG: cardiolipin synthase, partial [Ruminococcus sp.]|nr:cardiolipin synthase [Ruminococcus sp.]